MSETFTPIEPKQPQDELLGKLPALDVTPLGGDGVSLQELAVRSEPLGLGLEGGADTTVVNGHTDTETCPGTCGNISCTGVCTCGS